MGKFADNVWFEIEHCCRCSMAFAMPVDFQNARRRDHQNFYCPAGHAQHYVGKSEEQKLREQLQGAADDLARARMARDLANEEVEKVRKAHNRMRQRVMNGVCPCCNRTFENLRRHMHDKHPEFGQPETLAALRKAFGLTQRDVAAEAGVNPSYVSLYENGKPVPSVAGARLDSCLQHQEPRRAKGGRA